jgi:hypothetical protein
MSGTDDRTFEARILDQHPEMREDLSKSEEFLAWRNSLPSVVIDEEKLYIRGGDMLKDEDQIMFEWARKHGVLPDESVANGSASGEGASDRE